MSSMFLLDTTHELARRLELAGLEVTRHTHVDQLDADLSGRPFAVVLVSPAHRDAVDWVASARARTTVLVVWLGGPETWPRAPRWEPGVDVDVVFDPSNDDEIRLAVRRATASLTRESSSSRVFRSAATGIATTDLEGRVRQMNAAYARMLERSPEVLLGVDLTSLTHPDDRARVQALVGELREGRRDHAVLEQRYVTEARREVWCRVSFAVERSAAGTITGIVWVAEDVSDLKVAEAELTAALAREQRARREADEASATYRRTAALLQMACRVVRMGAWWVDLGAEPVLSWSDEVFAIFGLRPGRAPTVEEALARYTPAAREAVQVALSRCIETGEPYDVEGEIVRADGVHVWTRSIGEAVRDGSGRVTRVQGALLDITAERVAEASISESRRRFQQLADAMPFIVWTATADGSVDYSNAAFFAYTGVPTDAPPETRWQPCLHPDDVAACFETWAACVRDGTPYEIEYRLRRRDGAYRWFRVNAVPIRDPDGSVRVWYGTGIDVDENKRLERDASRTAARLSATIESLTDAFVLVDDAWRLVHVNAEAERLLGRPRADLLGADLWSHLRDEPGNRFEAHVRRAADERVAVDFDTHYEALDTWFEVRAFPSDEGLAIYVRDVTERRRLLERLRESELRFRQLAKATNDAIWDWNLLTHELWWNEGFEALFGYDRSEIEPTIESWTTRVHPEDHEAVVGGVDAALAAHAPGWSGEYRFRRKDGSYAFVFDRGHVLYDTGGRPVRMIGGMTDLTDWKKAEETLAEQAELLDHAQDAIFVVGADERVTYWNSGAERLIGWSSTEAVGQRVDTLLRLDVGAIRRCISEAGRDGGWTAELELLSRVGEPRTVASRWSVLAGRSSRGVLVIATDVTQRKHIEAQLMRAQRLESVGTLAGGIAHDLNNVLAPILTSVEMLRDGEQDPERLEDLEVLEASATRGAEMVRQLLAFARGRTGDRREPTDLADIVADVLRITHETFPKNVTARFVRGVSWPIQADPTQMHQLLMNLCVNARDAMPNGGLLTLAVEGVVLDESYAGMNVEARPGPYVLVRVEDTGLGMTQDVQNRIFEPFFTTKELGKGTGLGLSTCHAIVKNHGGFIHVYSEPNKGTRFKIYLPAEASRTSIDTIVMQTAGLPRGNGELVLIVDDEEAIRRVTSRTLERYGYRAIVAANGAEAVSLYAQHQGEVAVVLTDMSMPIMDGPATIVALKAIDPNVLIIGSSGLDANGMLAKAMGAGVVDFVPKPYGAEALLQRIHRVLQGRRRDG